MSVFLQNFYNLQYYLQLFIIRTGFENFRLQYMYISYEYSAFKMFENPAVPKRTFRERKRLFQTSVMSILISNYLPIS